MKVVKSLGIYSTNYSVRLSVCLLCHAVFSSKLWLFSVAALKSMFLISKNISMNNVNIIIYTLTHFFLLASLFIFFATYGCRYYFYEYVKINLSLIPCLYPTTLPISLFLSLFSFLSIPFIFNYPLNFFEVFCEESFSVRNWKSTFIFLLYSFFPVLVLLLHK